MRDLLSVIITAYNVGQYLEQCIDSVLMQSYKNLEVIIVDDGSEDNSRMICDQFVFKDSRVKIIHKKNEGVIKARYDGVRNSKGDYVTFVDGDDWIAADMYERLMRRLLEHDAEFISSGIIRYYSENEKKIDVDLIEAGFYNHIQINEKLLPKMLWNFNSESFGMDPSLCTKIFVREKIYRLMKKLIQKNYIFHYGEDVAILYPYILNIKSMVVVDEQYYFHRQRNRDLLASYIIDEEYFEKLFMLYQHLKEVFSHASLELGKQLEYFYMHSVSIRKKYYNDITEKVKYIFPFDKVSKGSKIILYGAGVVGSTYFHQIKKINYCEVILWVDKNSLSYRNKGYEIKDVDDILNVEYDYIVLCNSVKNIFDQIKIELIKMGVSEAKIV
ncbi:glycosyltransferase family 2 protein [Lacrimispora celerecrescens]|uniref:Glycosyltransferase involved in cell wall biosynthesis n=1 Tax=[Clostridium] celerecrescens 18A TaxID=1286362 RepID=A0A2M8ZCI7_9FIRM|nr:glycosyltransferase family 2 protein [Lacrimispora celerecrescens]PJJ31138.1 glycosyltransferase involved in cell wall biosynthesis [[Clostridium] celerecrescens 18A]